MFVDEEKRRILAAGEQKIAGREVVAPPEAGLPPSSNVVDLMEALRASLRTAAPPTQASSTRSARETSIGACCAGEGRSQEVIAPPHEA